MSLVRLEGVAKHVLLPDDTRLEILRGIDLAVAAGDHVAIVGRSGSGKSTLLNLLGMLDTPSEGAVWFRGEPVRRMRRGRLDRLRGRNVGFVFQQFNLLAGRTALENVEMPLGYAGGRAFWTRRRAATEMLERVGLGHRIDSTPEQMSGGEQQRVAIARALVRRPALILADEPTGALDVETGGTVMELLDDIASEADAALVTITHDLHVAARARRHFRLEAGVLTPFDLTGAGAPGGDPSGVVVAPELAASVDEPGPAAADPGPPAADPDQPAVDPDQPTAGRDRHPAPAPRPDAADEREAAEVAS
ncbi:ABC transporter ATP-binding protein [Microbacterium sp. M3]|uniref:ABC transporter ATP-binding protein n=1 Tax=Microbacterium arthrosphaerae TaxID=792652 RepID=A0ABU4H1W4_9MICO|nr:MULTISPECIES: ABC transporter ATP-binding protein [Microbacterium]MDW4573325.1 ABC transporter ATP-binding protein [Microbacterium arthrosphaerae]MDW7607180.1 ABC transporter ATP-binding protein [Microbacterium sp. M3]